MVDSDTTVPNKAIETLTQKQRGFVLEYLVDMNTTQPAIRAG